MLRYDFASWPIKKARSGECLHPSRTQHLLLGLPAPSPWVSIWGGLLLRFIDRPSHSRASFQKSTCGSCQRGWRGPRMGLCRKMQHQTSASIVTRPTARHSRRLSNQLSTFTRHTHAINLAPQRQPANNASTSDANSRLHDARPRAWDRAMTADYA